MKSSSLIHKAAQVFMKDVRSELKTRYGIGSVALFAVTSLVVASFAVSPYALEADTQSAFLWIVLFFSAMSGLSRSFVKEEETKTALALKLSAPPLAIYFGKLLFNLVLMLGVEAIVVPMFLLFMDISLSSPLVFAASVLLGDALPCGLKHDRGGNNLEGQLQGHAVRSPFVSHMHARAHNGSEDDSIVSFGDGLLLSKSRDGRDCGVHSDNNDAVFNAVRVRLERIAAKRSHLFFGRFRWFLSICWEFGWR